MAGLTGQDFEMWQGEDETIQIPVTDGDGSPVNMAGASVTWVMFAGATVAVTKTAGSGVEITDGDGTSDLLVVTIEKSDTLTLAPGYYEHECRVVNGGDEQIVCSGTVRLRRSSTAA